MSDTVTKIFYDVPINGEFLVFVGNDKIMFTKVDRKTGRAKNGELKTFETYEKVLVPVQPQFKINY